MTKNKRNTKQIYTYLSNDYNQEPNSTKNKMKLSSNLQNPFLRESPFKTLTKTQSNRKNKAKLGQINHNGAKKQRQLHSIQSCTSFHRGNESLSSISFHDQLSCFSIKNTKSKEFQLQRKYMKVYGPEIIRYQINESSVLKQYYNNKEKPNKTNQNRYQHNRSAAREYYFVAKQQQPYLQYNHPLIQNNQFDNIQPKKKESTSKNRRQLKLKKSLSWQVQDQQNSIRLPTFRNPSMQIQPSQLLYKLQSSIQNKQKFDNKQSKFKAQINEDLIIQNSISNSDSLINMQTGSPLQFNSSGLSKIMNQKYYKQKQAYCSMLSWSKYGSMDYESNQNKKSALINNNFVKNSSKKKKKDQSTYPSKIQYENRKYQKIRI